MSKKLYACLAVLGLAASTGCSMCQGPFDYTYTAFGGRWQRADPVHGRVGSAFHPAGGTTTQETWEEITVETKGGDGESVLVQPEQGSPRGQSDSAAGDIAPLTDDALPPGDDPASLLDDTAPRSDVSLPDFEDASVLPMSGPLF